MHANPPCPRLVLRMRAVGFASPGGPAATGPDLRELRVLAVGPWRNARVTSFDG